MRGADEKATVTAYREIKNRILDLRYPSGTKLSETRIAAELGLGRSPIRSALARLKEEGWVAITPQSGTYVKALTARDIADVLELRLLLEAHVVERATSRISELELQGLKRALAMLAPHIIEGRLDEFIELDDQIHSAIYRAADNNLIATILYQLREKIRWIMPTSAATRERQKRALRELEAIVEALQSRDAAAAVARMREHVRNAAAFDAEAEE
ncbi:MAG TPA: GntR family transcriptional regulator [Stellaceae bacterium]|nr:GntR family transcriptional regulator [Stellaceae bacterium]